MKAQTQTLTVRHAVLGTLFHAAMAAIALYIAFKQIF